MSTRPSPRSRASRSTATRSSLCGAVHGAQARAAERAVAVPRHEVERLGAGLVVRVPLFFGGDALLLDEDPPADLARLGGRGAAPQRIAMRDMRGHWRRTEGPAKLRR